MAASQRPNVLILSPHDLGGHRVWRNTPGLKGGNGVRVDDLEVLSCPAWQSMVHDCPKPPPKELYDVVADPLEQRNLADGPGVTRVRRGPRQTLREFMARTSSPLLNAGHVPPTEIQRERAPGAQPGGARSLQTVAARKEQQMSQPT